MTQIQLVSIGIDAWRVVHAARGPIGQVALEYDSDGPRFAAKRFRPVDRRFHPIGRFWNRDEAIDVLVRST